MNFTEFIRAYDISSSVYLDMGNEPSKKVIFPVGKQFINANFSPYYDKRGEVEGVVVVLQDITEQKSWTICERNLWRMCRMSCEHR